MGPTVMGPPASRVSICIVHSVSSRYDLVAALHSTGCVVSLFFVRLRPRRGVVPAVRMSRKLMERPSDSARQKP